MKGNRVNIASAQARFQKGIDRLATQTESDTGVAIDRSELAQVLRGIEWEYHGRREGTALEKELPHSLGKLCPAIDRVTSILGVEPNQTLLGDSDAERQRIDSIVVELQALRKKALSVLDAEAKAKIKGKKGKRTERRDRNLYDAVRALRGYWTKVLGLKFKQGWAQNPEIGRDAEMIVPVSPASKFVYSAMTFIDRTTLPKLRKVMSNIIGGK